MPASVLAIEGDSTTGTEQGIVPAETTTDVADLSLDIEWETPGLYLSEPKLANLLVIEAHTNSQAVTVAVVVDGTATTLNTSLNTASKSRVEIPLALAGTIWAVRFSATGLTSRIEISTVELNFPDSGAKNPE